ncbi:unnamed protein product [Strongylus vulgaris]|uniref:Uncharacterized protein n=1 Tax=Strongylus vulgaris TaxID=40348 RepID=A0A3P7JCP9_STRVU|nr:unnamed protein product [Strongylus vulgaris]
MLLRADAALLVDHSAPPTDADMKKDSSASNKDLETARSMSPGPQGEAAVPVEMNIAEDKKTTVSDESDIKTAVAATPEKKPS